MNNPREFKWRHFEAEIILLCVRWYLRYEVMNMVRKGQMRGVERGDIMGQSAFIASLFGVAA
jgi:transposase-like protein